MGHAPPDQPLWMLPDAALLSKLQWRTSRLRGRRREAHAAVLVLIARREVDLGWRQPWPLTPPGKPVTR